MIYTVTVNPSLDYVVGVDSFQAGQTNRTTDEKIFPGGKGINVSMVLRNLGYDSTALGFVAGFTGDELVKLLEAEGIRQEFVSVRNGFTRINVKLKSVEGTEINGQGPMIGDEDIQRLFERLEKLERGDILFLEGSIPGTMSQDLYGKIAERLEGRGITIVADAAGELLTTVLPYRPFLIKPNHHELSEIFKVPVHSREQAIPCCKKLQEMGAVNVLASLAGEGAVLLTEEGAVISHAAPEGTLVNGVGAGDSMVAGFMAGWLMKHDYEFAYRLGASAGSASAFSEGLATGDEIRNVLKNTFGECY